MYSGNGCSSWTWTDSHCTQSPCHWMQFIRRVPSITFYTDQYIWLTKLKLLPFQIWTQLTHMQPFHTLVLYYLEWKWGIFSLLPNFLICSEGILKEQYSITHSKETISGAVHTYYMYILQREDGNFFSLFSFPLDGQYACMFVRYTQVDRSFFSSHS